MATPPKKRGALRKLFGTVVVAGASYAVVRYIESRRRKKSAKEVARS